MVRGKPTDPKVREIIINQYHKGKTMREISNELTLATTTVFNVIKKYGETASIDVRGKSSGRPKAVSQRSVRHLIRICKSGRRNTLREVTARWNEQTGMNVSRECCRKYIHKSGLSFYKAKEKPLLTKTQIRKRYIWAKSKLSWTKHDWDKVIYSDESKFDVCVGDYRKRVIREKTEAFHKDCLKRTVKFPKGIMVWGCMSAKGLGTLHFIEGTVNAEKYQDILERSLLPSAAKLYPSGDFILQQDGASCHTAKSTKKWMGEHDIKVLSHPSSSPDINPIETLWHKMKQHLRNNPQRTLPQLRAKLQEIWDSFTPDFCAGLVNTMPKRVQAVIRAKGDVTPY